MKTKAPISFELFGHILTVWLVAIAGAWFEEPNLYLIAVVALLSYIARILFVGVRLLGEIRDKMNGER